MSILDAIAATPLPPCERGCRHRCAEGYACAPFYLYVNAARVPPALPRKPLRRWWAALQLDEGGINDIPRLKTVLHGRLRQMGLDQHQAPQQKKPSKTGVILEFLRTRGLIGATAQEIAVASGATEAWAQEVIAGLRRAGRVRVIGFGPVKNVLGKAPKVWAIV